MPRGACECHPGRTSAPRFPPSIEAGSVRRPPLEAIFPRRLIIVGSAMLCNVNDFATRSHGAQAAQTVYLSAKNLTFSFFCHTASGTALT